MANFITHESVYYTRMMLFSWSGDSIPTNLSESNAQYFVSCINNEASDNERLIVVNCNNIIDIDDHVIDPIVKYVQSSSRAIIFFSNDGQGKVFRHLNYHFDKGHYSELRTNSFIKNDISCVCLNTKEMESSETLCLIRNAWRAEDIWLKKEVKNSYSKFNEDRILSSTPLLAKGEFNAAAIISEPMKFKWIVILLVEKIYNVILLDKPQSYTLIEASLRGAAIAGSVWGILRFLSGVQLFVVDHIGPKHDILDTPSYDLVDPLNYCVYIGDFIIAGTEVKLTSAYCNFLGGQVKHAFSIGNYTRNKILGNDVTIHGLVNLQDCVSGLTYTLG